MSQSSPGTGSLESLAPHRGLQGGDPLHAWPYKQLVLRRNTSTFLCLTTQAPGRLSSGGGPGKPGNVCPNLVGNSPQVPQKTLHGSKDAEPKADYGHAILL